jgi:uncharacterized cupredoxin-like copper-binding protein
MKLTRPIIVAAALAAALAGAALAGVVAHKSATVKTITVTEKEFRIGLSTKKGAVGPVRFVVKNAGKYPHALAISGPGVRLKKTALIKPGKSATLTVTLKSGTYALWCPVPGHAAKGMKATITVPAAAGGGGTTTTTPDTTTGAPGG